jgi:hypothetical protein
MLVSQGATRRLEPADREGAPGYRRPATRDFLHGCAHGGVVPDA